MLKIAMLSTGEEVLHGDIVDTNAAWLSQQMFEQGFSICKRSTVGDEIGSLTEELVMLSFNSDIVIVNGGLGPTSDDLSTEAAGRASEQPLVLFEEWFEHMRAFFQKRGKEMPECNRKQAMLPQGAAIIHNPIGTACGFKLQLNDCIFYFTPGVPKEFKLMVTEQIIPDLRRNYPDVTGLECSKLYTFGTSESALSEKLDKVQLPDGYTIGYRCYLPFIEVKLFGPKNQLQVRLKVLDILLGLINQHVISIDETMQERVAHLIEDKGYSISTAEQSTYGMLSQWLQSFPKAANYCGHGWILGDSVNVGDELTDSLASALALAAATRDKCSTDIAIVTGKVSEKVFSVVIAVPEGEWGQTVTFKGEYAQEDRSTLITTLAADMLRRYLASQVMFPDYGVFIRNKEIFIPRTMIAD